MYVWIKVLGKNNRNYQKKMCPQNKLFQLPLFKAFNKIVNYKKKSFVEIISFSKRLEFRERKDMTNNYCYLCILGDIFFFLVWTT